ncbi:Phenazine biosynthesis-like domain-containing protein [Varanus komodoensis]|nr:Phenazine biosynthesis-like domain-containing protein [Varanus komodoensis]
MEISLFIVDAFTNQPFHGNPAAVCLLENRKICNVNISRKCKNIRKAMDDQAKGPSSPALCTPGGKPAACTEARLLPSQAPQELVFLRHHGTLELEEDCLQKIAAEMNLSETAFIRKLHPTDDFTESSCFGLRWFTPTNEVPLCGHATLASAAVLFQNKKNANFTLTFLTLSGELNARQASDHIILDFPLYSTYPQELQEVEELVQAAVGDLNVQDVRYSPETRKLLVCLSDVYERSDLEKIKVNAQELLSAEKTGKVKGLIVTLKGDFHRKHEGHDFYSRYFAPWNGISEDPVTGSAHTVLSSYWSQKLGKTDLCGKHPYSLIRASFIGFKTAVNINQGLYISEPLIRPTHHWDEALRDSPKLNVAFRLKEVVCPCIMACVCCNLPFKSGNKIKILSRSRTYNADGDAKQAVHPGLDSAAHQCKSQRHMLAKPTSGDSTVVPQLTNASVHDQIGS